MGLFQFHQRTPGKNCLGPVKPKTAQDAATTNRRLTMLQRRTKAAAAIRHYITTLNLGASRLGVSFDGSSGVVTVSGTAVDQASKERILLAAGNVQGVGEVQDNMSVSSPEPEAVFYTVKRGDTLSAIAKTNTAAPTSTWRFSRPANRCCRIRTRSIRGRCCAFRRRRKTRLPLPGSPCGTRAPPRGALYFETMCRSRAVAGYSQRAYDMNPGVGAGFRAIDFRRSAP